MDDKFKINFFVELLFKKMCSKEDNKFELIVYYGYLLNGGLISLFIYFLVYFSLFFYSYLVIYLN